MLVHYALGRVRIGPPTASSMWGVLKSSQADPLWCREYRSSADAIFESLVSDHTVISIVNWIRSEFLQLGFLVPRPGCTSVNVAGGKRGWNGVWQVYRHPDRNFV
jgi:hypothetical protein